MTPHIYEVEILVGPEHLDGQGHVNNVVFLQWMQEVAAAHWAATAPQAEQARLRWVVTRHEIDYHAPAFAGERLTARTWIGSWTGATCERFLEFRREGRERPLARARSIWAALDAATGRPTRLSERLAAYFATG